MYKIYKLVYQGNVIYIGRTKRTLKERKSSGYQYIDKSVLKETLIELIEETDDKSRESYWIVYYSDLGCNLYNKRKEYCLSKNEWSRINSKKEKRIEYRKNYRKTEKAINYNKEYENKRKKDEKRKEYVSEYNKNYRKLNIEYFKQKKKEWYQKNKNKNTQ